MNWKCPKCGATPDSHGKGKCEYTQGGSGSCYGFVCECDNDRCEATDSDPCPAANCYHCGWGGTFPPPPIKLKGWAKTAVQLEDIAVGAVRMSCNVQRDECSRRRMS